MAVKTSPKGRWEGRKFLQTSRFAYCLESITSHDYHKQTRLCNPRAAEYHSLIMNENRITHVPLYVDGVEF